MCYSMLLADVAIPPVQINLSRLMIMTVYIAAVHDGGVSSVVILRLFNMLSELGVLQLQVMIPNQGRCMRKL